MLKENLMSVKVGVSKSMGIFGIITICVSLALIFVLADLFSSVLTLGDFAFLNATGSKSSSYKIYAISLNKTLSKESADNFALEIKQKGGAGFVFKKEEQYYILASAYENENDAIKVRDKLGDDKIDSEIVEIDIGEIKIDMNFSSAEKITMTNSINLFKEIFKKLYNISIELDTSIKSLTECKLLVNEERNYIDEIKKSFDNSFNNKLNNEIIKIRTKIIELEAMTEKLISEASEQSSIFSSQLKYAYIQAIILNRELVASLNL